VGPGTKIDSRELEYRIVIKLAARTMAAFVAVAALAKLL
jgi:hypothetical protein